MVVTASLVVSSALLSACGGPAPKPAEAPCPTAAPVAEKPKSDPPPFTGTFELVRGTDGQNTVEFTRLFKQSAYDGRILWTIEPDRFSVAVWVLGSYIDPKTDAKSNDERELFAMCRGITTVTARYEGATVQLPGSVEVKGYASAILSEKKREKDKTTTRTMTKDNTCSASIDAASITFEVVEKDADGPVKLKAKANGGEFELQRSTPVDKLDQKMLVQTASMR